MEKLKETDIIYEDNHLIVVHKKPGIPVCEDESHDKDLLTILKEYLKEKYHKPGNVYLGLVHRLDRPTEGIIVFAKTSKAASRLSKQIQDNTFKKTYYAVIEGKPKNKDELIDYLVKDEKTNKSYITEKDKGKLATLTYELINSVNNLSLVKINLKTGRHHQIRVQFSSRNMPLYADHKYNKNIKKDDKNDIALIAKEISFYHPTTKALLHFEIDLPKKYPYTLF